MKDMVIAGCRVHLAYHSRPHGRWSVEGTIRCGLDENSGEQSFRTHICASRHAAEQAALRIAGGLLGRNVDRNTSRVTNWS